MSVRCICHLSLVLLSSFLAGAIDALMLLDPYIAPGCIILFDDLINYPDYREHEIKALWEWLEASKRQVEVCNTPSWRFGLLSTTAISCSHRQPCLARLWCSAALPHLMLAWQMEMSCGNA